MKPMKTDPVERAKKAWFRAGNTAQPSNGSGIYEADGREYVKLSNVSGTLAVYQIGKSGRLKRMDLENTGACAW